MFEVGEVTAILDSIGTLQRTNCQRRDKNGEQEVGLQHQERVVERVSVHTTYLSEPIMVHSPLQYEKYFSSQTGCLQIALPVVQNATLCKDHQINETNSQFTLQSPPFWLHRILNSSTYSLLCKNKSVNSDHKRNFTMHHQHVNTPGANTLYTQTPKPCHCFLYYNVTQS
jgi:hypothetical protein